MSLLDLTIDDLRCVERAELHLHPGHNLIWGGNGSGKTSLLEAIFLLGRGRSFRTRNSERLIRHGRDRLVVFGRTGSGESDALVSPERDGPFVRIDLATAGEPLGQDLRSASAEDRQFAARNGGEKTAAADSQLAGQVPAFPALASDARASVQAPTQALGIQVSRPDGTTARINGATARSLTELTQAFPVQVIDPGIHKLVEEGSNRRRRWMDWAVFHVEHQFGDWWLRYTRILKQRNAALRTQPGQVTAWDTELAASRRTHC